MRQVQYLLQGAKWNGMIFCWCGSNSSVERSLAATLPPCKRVRQNEPLTPERGLSRKNEKKNYSEFLRMRNSLGFCEANYPRTSPSTSLSMWQPSTINLRDLIRKSIQHPSGSTSPPHVNVQLCQLSQRPSDHAARSATSSSAFWLLSMLPALFPREHEPLSRLCWPRVHSPPSVRQVGLLHARESLKLLLTPVLAWKLVWLLVSFLYCDRRLHTWNTTSVRGRFSLFI